MIEKQKFWEMVFEFKRWEDSQAPEDMDRKMEIVRVMKTVYESGVLQDVADTEKYKKVEAAAKILDIWDEPIDSGQISS